MPSESVLSFVDAMNEHANTIGMLDTVFVNPTGLTTGNVSTPLDLLKLGLEYISDRERIMFWSRMNYVVNIYGQNKRTVNGLAYASGTAIYASSSINKKYGGKTLGIKGGSLTYEKDRYRGQIVLVDIQGHPYLVALLTSGEKGFSAMYKACGELISIINASLLGEPCKEPRNNLDIVVKNGGYAAVEVPPVLGVAYCYNYDTNDLIKRSNSFSENADVRLPVASVAKLMTAIVAMEYITDLNTPVSVLPVDAQSSGSGIGILAGDILRFRDAANIMIMNSDNTIAEAIGRSVGQIIKSQNAVEQIRFLKEMNVI